MNEQMREKLSAFMDGELDDAQLIQHLESDPDTRATWLRYHMIRDAMHQTIVPGAQSLADRVFTALKDEPTVLAPRRRYTPKYIARQVTGVALAATVATVAIFVVRETPPPVENNPTVAVAPITFKPVRLTADEERKLSGYVVSHTQYSASARMKGMLPYTRIVSLTPAQSFAQRKAANDKK